MEYLRLCSCIHMTTAVLPLNIQADLSEVFTHFHITSKLNANQECIPLTGDSSGIDHIIAHFQLSILCYPVVFACALSKTAKKKR